MWSVMHPQRSEFPECTEISGPAPSKTSENATAALLQGLEANTLSSKLLTRAAQHEEASLFTANRVYLNI